MATHSSILAWRIPWTEKPGGQQSLGWQKVGHNLATKSPPHGNSVFSFKGISIPFSIVHVSAYIPTNSVGGFPFLHSLSSIYCLFSSVQSLSHVRIFVTPWTAARQASLSITNSWSLVKLMSIESVMRALVNDFQVSGEGRSRKKYTLVIFGVICEGCLLASRN